MTLILNLHTNVLRVIFIHLILDSNFTKSKYVLYFFGLYFVCYLKKCNIERI
jgi:hypothetical protein